MLNDEIVKYPINFRISQMIKIYGHCNCAYMKELVGNPFIKYSRGYYSDDPSRCDCGMEQVSYRAPLDVGNTNWYAQTEFNPFIETYFVPMVPSNFSQYLSTGVNRLGLVMTDGRYVSSSFYTKSLNESLPTGELLYTHLWSISKHIVARFDINVLESQYYELTVVRGKLGKPVLYVKINMLEDILDDDEDTFPMMNQYGFESLAMYRSGRTVHHLWNNESDIWMPAQDTSWYKSGFVPEDVYLLQDLSRCFHPMAYKLIR